ncbi:hypothetical protein [Allofournierella massiliensis]|uniref:hypothetical protein n=1 Tax=Allofournierella massiliensis TaxID=1650663 RepID=UPI0039A25558
MADKKHPRSAKAAESQRAAAIIPRGGQLAQTFVKLFGKIEIEKTRENKSKRENKRV